MQFWPVAPKIELAIRSKNASSGRDMTSVSANSERREHVGINAFFENASGNNNALCVSNVNDETRHSIPDEVTEFLVPETHFDRQPHTHHSSPMRFVRSQMWHLGFSPNVGSFFHHSPRIIAFAVFCFVLCGIEVCLDENFYILVLVSLYWLCLHLVGLYSRHLRLSWLFKSVQSKLTFQMLGDRFVRSIL